MPQSFRNQFNEPDKHLCGQSASTLFTQLNGPCHRHKSCWLLKISFYFSFIYFNHFLLLPTVSIRFYLLAKMRPLFANSIYTDTVVAALLLYMLNFNIHQAADKYPCNDCNFNWEESNKIIFSRLINCYCSTREMDE